jgi:hypothetical protein
MEVHFCNITLGHWVLMICFGKDMWCINSTDSSSHTALQFSRSCFSGCARLCHFIMLSATPFWNQSVQWISPSKTLLTAADSKNLYSWFLDIWHTWIYDSSWNINCFLCRSKLVSINMWIPVAYCLLWRQLKNFQKPRRQPSSGTWQHLVWQKFYQYCGGIYASIFRVKQAKHAVMLLLWSWRCSPEMSVNIHQTTQCHIEKMVHLIVTAMKTLNPI